MLLHLGISEPGKMLGPDPSDSVVWIILVFRQPELSFLAKYIENLDKQSASER